MGRPGCLLEAPGAPREARPPKAAQRHSKETVWVVWGCLLEVSGPPLGGLRAPKGTPKSLQGRGQYEASDLKLTQTKASELKLHSSFPQGHWSSRSRGGIREAKTIFRPTSRLGYQFAEREVDFKAPTNGRFEGPGRSILRYQRGVHLKALEGQF